MTTADPNPWETLHVLSSAVTDATRRVERDSELNERRIKASVEKMRWYRRAAVTSLAAAALSLFVGYQALHNAHQLKTQRQESRRITCERDNANAAKINALGNSVRQIITIATPANPNRTVEQQAQVDRFVSESDAALDRAKVSARDCSPAGLAQFYKGN